MAGSSMSLNSNNGFSSSLHLGIHVDFSYSILISTSKCHFTLANFFKGKHRHLIPLGHVQTSLTTITCSGLGSCMASGKGMIIASPLPQHCLPWCRSKGESCCICYCYPWQRLLRFPPCSWQTLFLDIILEKQLNLPSSLLPTSCKQLQQWILSQQP